MQIRGEEPNQDFFKKNSQIPYSGWAVEYHSNGQIKTLMQLYKGKRHGQTAGWYEGGQMGLHEIYKEGFPHGKQVRYFENGQIQATAYVYKSGPREFGPHGEVSIYSESGQLEAERNFSRGKLDGAEIVYYVSGQIKSQFNFKDDKEHGKCILFAEDGEITMEYDYSNGKLNTAIASISNGKRKTVVKNGNGTLMARIPFWEDDDKFYPHKVQNGVIESAYKVSDRILKKMKNDSEAELKRFLEETQRETEARQRNSQRYWNRRR